MDFAYTARSIAGELSSGILGADTSAQVQQQLRDKGLFVVTLRPTGGETKAGLREWRMPWGRRGVPAREVLTLTSQLAVMARSGVALANALGTLAQQATHPVLAAALTQVHRDVSSGQTISSSLRNQGHVFGGAYVASVAAGEASGRLPDTLQRQAEMLRAGIRRRNTLRGLLAYPLVLATVSFLVMGGLMFFVLPEFSNVFADLNMPLPTITQFLLDLSASLRAYWFVWLGAVAALPVLWFSLRSRPDVRRRRDWLLLHVVGLREVTRALAVGRTFRLLGTMLESGVPLLDALRLTHASQSNQLYRELFGAMEADVLNGRGLQVALAQRQFVPAAAAQMIATGERTGTLAAVTQVMGEFYEEEGENRLRELATLLEPAIIIVMGVLVACVVLAVMLPLFDFASMTQG